MVVQLGGFKNSHLPITHALCDVPARERRAERADGESVISLKLSSMHWPNSGPLWAREMEGRGFWSEIFRGLGSRGEGGQDIEGVEVTKTG